MHGGLLTSLLAANRSRGCLWGTRGSRFCPCRFDGEAPHDFSHAPGALVVIVRHPMALPSVTCGLAACKTLACSKPTDKVDVRRRSTVLYDS